MAVRLAWPSICGPFRAPNSGPVSVWPWLRIGEVSGLCRRARMHKWTCVHTDARRHLTDASTRARTDAHLQRRHVMAARPTDASVQTRVDASQICQHFRGASMRVRAEARRSTRPLCGYGDGSGVRRRTSTGRPTHRHIVDTSIRMPSDYRLSRPLTGEHRRILGKRVDKSPALGRFLGLPGRAAFCVAALTRVFCHA